MGPGAQGVPISATAVPGSDLSPKELGSPAGVEVTGGPCRTWLVHTGELPSACHAGRQAESINGTNPVARAAIDQPPLRCSRFTGRRSDHGSAPGLLPSRIFGRRADRAKPRGRPRHRLPALMEATAHSIRRRRGTSPAAGGRPIEGAFAPRAGRLSPVEVQPTQTSSELPRKSRPSHRVLPGARLDIGRDLPTARPSVRSGTLPSPLRFARKLSSTSGRRP